jgi:hypothetical protein
VRRRISIFAAVVLTFGPVALLSQQPNGGTAMALQFRQGPPYPIVASAPNNGTLSVVITGAANAPFVIATGPFHPGAASVAGGNIDVGTPPAFADLVIVADGLVNPAMFSVGPGGGAGLNVTVPPNATIALPPLQAAVLDPFSPAGYALTAASVVTLEPAKSILFVQGDFDPGFGAGPHCRLADTSPVGYSQLRDLLLLAGFSQASEVVDTAVTITPQVLAPHGVVVLGTNQRALAASEVDAIEAYVRAGGGLVSYSDFMFGPGAPGSDNQVLSRFGLLTTSDNFGGAVLASTFAPHAIAAGLSLGVRGEGVSILEIVGNATDVFMNVIPCLSNAGACFPLPSLAPSGSAAPTYTACAAVEAGVGRVVATFDRNTFFNYPGYGSNLFDVSNAQYAVNLFVWAGGY